MKRNVLLIGRTSECFHSSQCLTRNLKAADCHLSFQVSQFKFGRRKASESIRNENSNLDRLSRSLHSTEINMGWPILVLNLACEVRRQWTKPLESILQSVRCLYTVIFTPQYPCFIKYIGGPNQYVPQDICSSGQFLVAGRFGIINVSLEGKSEFCPMTTPKLASNVYRHTSAGKLPSNAGWGL